MLYICTMCGGNIEFNYGDKIGVCDSCGRQGTIPQDSSEQRLRQFNRANQYRQRFEFDKALANYEHILDDNDADAEAHWGAFLSRYGIEYVDENKSGQLKPTFHRMRMTSVLADADYLSAVKYASDEQTRQVYASRADEIAEIQREIIEVSKSKEQQYDVFICYKEKEGDSRTLDSVKAEEIYNYLTDKGYKVFFARRTLQLGVQYEPYIFSALQSARVMLVMGSKAEYFTSIWMKNEWCRYLDLIRENNKGRALIPCFWGLDPDEDLPIELSHLQAQDMNRVGALQDLYVGISKIISDGREKKTDLRESSEDRLEYALRNGETYLKLKNYDDAMDLYRGVTREHPEDYRGWWGCIVSKTKAFSVVFDDNTQNALDQWFGYVRALSEKNYPNAFDSMCGTYGNYLSKVAIQDAQKEFDSINNRIIEIRATIDYCRSKIGTSQKEIMLTNESIAKHTIKHNNTTKSENQVKAQLSKNIGQANIGITGTHFKNFFQLLCVLVMFIFTAFFFALLLGLLGIGNFLGVGSASGEGKVAGIIAAFLFFIFFGKYFIQSVTAFKENIDYIGNLKKYVLSMQSEQKSWSDRQQTIESNFEKQIASYKQYMADQQRYIAYQNERISQLSALEKDCHDYLALQISNNYFQYARCASVGITQPIDKNITLWHDRIEYLLNIDLSEGGPVV